MSEYEYEGRAEVVPLFVMIPGAAPVARIGIRELDAVDWVGEVLDDGMQLPETATVKLLGTDSHGVSREGWSAKAVGTSKPGRRAVLSGEEAFRPPA